VEGVESALRVREDAHSPVLRTALTTALFRIQTVDVLDGSMERLLE
jgi:hypothetical protein